MASTYNYYAGSTSNQSRPSVEISSTREVCVVDLASYVDGVEVFPCGSGNDKRLSTVDKANINRILAKIAGIEGITGYKIKKLRAKLERTIQAEIHKFYDWSDCVRWACSEININDGLLAIMYPTTQDYLAITQYKHINN